MKYCSLLIDEFVVNFLSHTILLIIYVYGLTFLKDQQVFPYIQNIGVVMLFLLSGFLLAYSLNGKSQSGDYTIAAFASHKTRRIFREYIPAFILIALLDALSI